MKILEISTRSGAGFEEFLSLLDEHVQEAGEQRNNAKRCETLSPAIS
jgi:hypothetical protein